MSTYRFPFGSTPTSRPPRRPAGACRLFVLGVYPSALHVRWTPPLWALDRDDLELSRVKALAVADEPTVFWDASEPDADKAVAAWRDEVGFRTGEGRDDWGRVEASANGTSGRWVVSNVLLPLGADREDTWFTDAVDHYFVKPGTATARGQLDVIDLYNRFAAASSSDLLPAELPVRPSQDALVALARRQHADRLRAEVAEASPRLIVTLGDEARRALLALADHAEGPPTQPLSSRSLAEESTRYGEAGSVTVSGTTYGWHALVHPGQRSTWWRTLHLDWIGRR